MNDIPADQVILYAALASRAENKDTIDLAVIGGLKKDQVEGLSSSPLPTVRSGAKRTEATIKATDGKQFYVAKGAPQVILAMAAMLVNKG